MNNDLMTVESIKAILRELNWKQADLGNKIQELSDKRSEAVNMELLFNNINKAHEIFEERTKEIKEVYKEMSANLTCIEIYLEKLDKATLYTELEQFVDSLGSITSENAEEKKEEFKNHLTKVFANSDYLNDKIITTKDSIDALQKQLNILIEKGDE